MGCYFYKWQQCSELIMLEIACFFSVEPHLCMAKVGVADFVICMYPHLTYRFC